MGLVFGFNDGEITNTADQLQGQDVDVEAFTVDPGETVTGEADGITNTYTATGD
jgi:hypothetical protein